MAAPPPSQVILNIVKAKASRRGPSAAGRAVGARIRQLRTRKGWSLEELAGRAQIHVTYLSSLERGHRNPTLNVLFDVARAFAVPVAELVKQLPVAQK